jgi:hypothetical protein
MKEEHDITYFATQIKDIVGTIKYSEDDVTSCVILFCNKIITAHSQIKEEVKNAELIVNRIFKSLETKV